MKIFYFPLEPYKERYTVQLSAAKCGWLESRWIENNVNYTRVDGRSINDDNNINVGSVLDANKRGYWCCSQIMNFLLMLDSGQVSSSDVLYFDDFWHPGISALPYSFNLTGINPKMYAMLHAQSVDIYDFTYPMRHWMRHFEKGTASILSGIFITSTCLYDMCLYAGVGDRSNLYITGLPFNSERVKDFYPKEIIKRKKQIVYSSRWDKEKRPDIFLKIAENVIKQDPSIQFVITTSAPSIRSNDGDLIDLLRRYIDHYPNHIILRENQTKTEYYKNLLESQIQINTADQDFVSWTLLEATLSGCRPLYPYYLSFPETLDYRADLMYNKNDISDAVNKILMYIDSDQEDWSWIYKKFDESWRRMLAIMKGENYEPLYSD